jgi:cobalamin biosynthesis Mg chelatase CobN
MLEKGPRPALSGQLVLGLVSVLALLALVPVPAVAQATDAYGAQYEDVPPVPTGNKKAKNDASADTPGASGQDAQAGAGSGGSGGDSSGGSSGAGANAQAEGKGDKGQSSPGPGSGKNEGKPLQSSDRAAATTSEEDDGGSSPLVPILLAVLVLAAISVGAVMLSKRRQRADSGDSGAPVSPEAN